MHVSGAIVHHECSAMLLLIGSGQGARTTPLRHDFDILIRDGPSVEITANLERPAPPEVIRASHPWKRLHSSFPRAEHHRGLQIRIDKIDGWVVELQVVCGIPNATGVGVEADASAMMPSPMGRVEAADAFPDPAEIARPRLIHGNSKNIGGIKPCPPTALRAIGSKGPDLSTKDVVGKDRTHTIAINRHIDSCPWSLQDVHRAEGVSMPARHGFARQATRVRTRVEALAIVAAVRRHRHGHLGGDPAPKDLVVSFARELRGQGIEFVGLGAKGRLYQEPGGHFAIHDPLG